MSHYTYLTTSPYSFNRIHIEDEYLNDKINESEFMEYHYLNGYTKIIDSESLIDKTTEYYG